MHQYVSALSPRLHCLPSVVCKRKQCVSAGSALFHYVCLVGRQKSISHHQTSCFPGCTNQIFLMHHFTYIKTKPEPLTLAVRWSGGSVESVLLAWSGLTYRLKRKSHCNWVESWSSLSCQDTCLSRGFWHIGTPSMSSRHIRESLLEEWSRVLVS